MNKSIVLSIIAVLFLCSFFRSDFRLFADDTKTEMSLDDQQEVEIEYFKIIAQQQELVKQLYTKGKIEEIKNLVFNKSKQIDEHWKLNRISEFTSGIDEFRLIFTGIPEVKDYLLFYAGQKYFITKQEVKAIPLLEELLNDYPHSAKYNSAYVLLEEIYFNLGEDKKFADICDKFPGINSLKQNFWIAHTYFNLGWYNQAREIFSVLAEKSVYGFRSQAMLALIKSFTAGPEDAINDFLILQNNYNQEYENYDFIIISLARLFALTEEIELATEYYLNYYKMQTDTVDDAILFEIASVFSNYGKYDHSMLFLDKIINSPKKSGYFVSAKYLKAILLQGSADAEEAEVTITDMIEQNNVLLEMLNTKYGLLKKYHSTNVDVMNKDITNTRKAQLEEVIVNIENSLEKTNNSLEDLYVGLNPGQLDMLKVLEQEYFFYSSTLAYMQVLIKLANTVPNKKIPRLLDMEIAKADSSRKSLEIIKYLGHLDQITAEDYTYAKIIVEEKQYHYDLIDIWDEIEQIARMNDSEEIIPYATSSKKILNENINSLNLIAEHLYSGEVDPELKKQLEEEIAAVEDSKQQLESLKEIVVKDFNKKIAKNLSSKKELLTAEFEELNLVYDTALSGIVTDIQDENDEHKLSILSILFRQTQIKDKEFRKLQEKVKNE